MEGRIVTQSGIQTYFAVPLGSKYMLIFPIQIAVVCQHRKDETPAHMLVLMSLGWLEN